MCLVDFSCRWVSWLQSLSRLSANGVPSLWKHDKTCSFILVYSGLSDNCIPIKLSGKLMLNHGSLGLPGYPVFRQTHFTPPPDIGCPDNQLADIQQNKDCLTAMLNPSPRLLISCPKMKFPGIRCWFRPVCPKVARLILAGVSTKIDPPAISHI